MLVKLACIHALLRTLAEKTSRSVRMPCLLLHGGVERKTKSKFLAIKQESRYAQGHCFFFFRKTVHVQGTDAKIYRLSFFFLSLSFFLSFCVFIALYSHDYYSCCRRGKRAHDVSALLTSRPLVLCSLRLSLLLADFTSAVRLFVYVCVCVCC